MQPTPYHIHPPSRTSFLTPQMFGFLCLMLIVIVVFTIINIGVREMGQYALLPASPFADFEDVFPGEPASAVAAHGFSCTNNNYYHNAAEVFCSTRPEEGDFSSVDVLIYQGKILKTTFLPREDKLTVGDLAVFLQTNKFRIYPSQVVFVSPQIVVIAKTAFRVGQGAAYLLVWSVAFIDHHILD